MVKNKFVCIVFNICLFFVLCLIVELLSYYKYSNDVSSILNEYKRVNKNLKLGYFHPIKFDINRCFKNFSEHKTTEEKMKEGSIIVFGSSYASGTGLSEKATFDYKLHNKTNRTVYRRAIPGGGPQYIYYMLKSGIIKNEIDDAKYIFYVYDPEHILMLEKFQMSVVYPFVNLRYELKDNSLKEITPFLYQIYPLFFVKNVQHFLEKQVVIKNKEKIYYKFNFLIKEIAKILKETYPSSKFIILEFPAHKNSYFSWDNIVLQEFPQNQIDYLENIGCTVINLNKLIKDNLDEQIYSRFKPCKISFSPS